MENLTDLQKKAIESLRSKRTLNTRNPQALEFSDDQIAEEMQLLQAGEQELQKRKEANAKVEEERQQRISDENDKEQTARLDKQYRNKALGLGQKYDPKMLEYASTIFPSLKEMGLSSGPISPEVKTARSPAVESPVSEEEMLDETENVAEEETTSPYNSIKKSVMKTEGGFSNNPDDKGGATNKGITLQTYSQFLGRPASVEELKNISDKDVDSIFSRYYNEAGGDRIKDPRIQEVLTDQNYNKGTNFLNRINDMLGTPRGSSLSQEAIDRINNMDPDQFIAAVLQSEREIYKKIAEKDPSQKQFSRGWDLRIQNLANKMGVNLETKMSEEKSESPNIAELIKKARQEQDEASTASQFAKLRDAIIGVGAGRVIKTDTSAYDERQLKALRPIEDLTLKQQLESNQAKNDPNSQISKLMRDSLKSLGLDIGSIDKVSYAQLEKLYPSLANAIMAKSVADAKRIDATAALKIKEQEKTEKSYEKTRTIVNNKVSKLIEGKTSPFTGYNQAKQTTQMLDNAISAWDDSDRDAKIKNSVAFMQYAKLAQGDDSVVRSSDMQALAGGLNYASPYALLNKFAAKAEGSPFTKDELLEMRKVIDTIRKVKKQQLQQRLDPIKLDAERGGYDLDQSISPDIIDEIYSSEAPTMAEKMKRLEELKKKQGK